LIAPSPYPVRAVPCMGCQLASRMSSTQLTCPPATAHPNPHNIGHTPGGSSAGSAAAVGAGTLTLALGTQTGGSVVRPAAFCGCVGFKPTRDLIPRSGVAMQSDTLDTVGVITGDVASARLLSEAASGKSLSATKLAKPRLLFAHPPGWEDADSDMQTALTDYVTSLGDICTKGELPAGFTQAPEARNRINFFEMAHFYAPILAQSPDQLSDVIKEAMAEGRGISTEQYRADLKTRGELITALNAVFDDYDAILTPPTLGTAPEGLASTGSSIFNGIWTLTQAPALTLPLLTGANGLPLGVQISGKPGEDARLLDIAQCLEKSST